MNKKITALISALVIALSLTACGGGNDKGGGDIQPPSASADSGGDENAEEEVYFVEDDGEEPADIIGEEDELDLGSLFPDKVKQTEAAEEPPAIEEEIPEVMESTAASDNPLMPMIDKVTAESEWPMLVEVTDDYLLTEFFLLTDTDNYNRFIVMQCPMSAKMSEIIVIDAADAEKAKSDLEARRQKAIDIDAWYPADKELADASIVGQNGSYVYYIIGDNAAAAEKSINAYIDANG